jgi:uncharacterized protein YwgA
MESFTTRDQALLALVVDEAGKLTESQKGYLGRTAVQKILYFLHVYGIPMRYRFDVHYYGPFCPQILSDVDWLMITDAIEDRSQDAAKYSNYRLGQLGPRLIKEFDDEVEGYRDAVRNVASALVPLSPDRLELLATLHYVYRELKASMNAIPPKEAVVSRFCEFKQDKFEQDEIFAAYDCLANAKLVDSATKKVKPKSRRR